MRAKEDENEGKSTVMSVWEKIKMQSGFEGELEKGRVGGSGRSRTRTRGSVCLRKNKEGSSEKRLGCVRPVKFERPCAV